jgi:Major Facilitator Superfamily
VPRPDDKQPHKRFTKSGHTTHNPRPLPPPGYPQDGPPPGYVPPPPRGDDSAAYGQPTEHRAQSRGGYDQPTYHHMHTSSGAEPTAQTPAPPTKNTVTRTVISRSHELTRGLARKVINASKADGAEESGLTGLIWNQVMSYGADAMIAVALATTVFFGASTHAQRGNVLLYLLITMAPFAVVAPVIGPALDRLQHGRRWAMAGSAIGRGILAAFMAQHPTELLVLYPCALGSLVLSKAYAVIRASAAPRLVPPSLTLVEANARLSIFGIGAGLIGGGFCALIIKATGDSYSAGLWAAAVAFFVCGYFAVRLPKHIDAVSSAPPPARAPRSGPSRVSLAQRMQLWARRGFVPAVITSLQGQTMLRFIAGFLPIFLAFHIEATSHGFDAALALGGVVIGSGAGSFAGTGIGTRLKLAHPERVILICAGTAAVACVLTALLFSIPIAIMCMFVGSTTNGLGKIGLDSVIQREVDESMRSSVFARSETVLQLAWVFGAALGVLLPSKNGSLAFWVAAGVIAVGTLLVLMRNRAMKRAASAAPRPMPPGNVAPGHQQS